MYIYFGASVTIVLELNRLFIVIKIKKLLYVYMYVSIFVRMSDHMSVWFDLFTIFTVYHVNKQRDRTDLNSTQLN